jgi:hypothetical protein
MKELTDFLDKYNVKYTIQNGYVIANDIDLSDNKISKLPENIHLIRCNWIDLSYNDISKLPENFHLIKCNWINLSYNNISKLPENFHLIECRNIYLSGNKISELSENFHLIKCNSLYLSFNKIIRLPENFHLIQCSSIYLSDNRIKKLSKNLHLLKCNALFLSSNKIGKLPKNFNLIKCNYLYLKYNISQLNYARQKFDCVEITNDYIFCDNLLTWITGKKQINEYTIYVGRFNEVIVTTDNKTFAHGDTIRQAISDLQFKLSDRNKNEYINIDKNVQYPINDMIVMYRVITGACAYGVEKFMQGKKFNETISLNEINAIIGNEYGSKSFREFFEFK